MPTQRRTQVYFYFLLEKYCYNHTYFYLSNFFAEILLLK